MTKEKTQKTCHDCWQYDQFCDKCNLGWCCWFAQTKSPSCAVDCESFNPKYTEGRKHRRQSWEALEKAKALYDFLSNGELPEGVHIKKPPKLGTEQAFSIVWFLQEITGVLPDCIEKCQGCDRLFNSDGEGHHISEDCFLIDENGKETKKRIPKKYWGDWCDNCVPVEYYF